MSCIRCGDDTEESAYLCEVCAETCFQDPIFLFSPNIIGEGLVERLRHQAAALIRLGPVTGGDIERIEGQSFFETVNSFNVKKSSEKETIAYYKIVNFVLGQYGVPLYADEPKLLLTEEATKVVSAVAHKVNALSTQFPNVMMSDIFLRMGLVYWSASRGVLMRAGPVKWCREKRKYTLLKALEYLKKIPTNDDLYSLALKMSGLVLLDAGGYAEAEEKLSGARKSFPEDMVIVKNLAKAHFKLGNLDEALSLLDHAISVSEIPDLWLEKGNFLRRSGRMDEAIGAYEEAIAIDRNCVKAYKRMISLLRRMGREEEAARVEADLKVTMEPGAAARLEEMLQAESMIVAEGATSKAREEPLIEPRRPRIKLEEIEDAMKAAKSAVNSGDFDTAIDILKHHLASKGERDHATMILLCRAYLYNGQFEDAMHIINTLLKSDRTSAAGWYWRAKIEFAKGIWGAAIQHMERATKLLPTFVDAFAEKGLIFLAHERYEEADFAFSEALKHDIHDARSWLGRAKALRKLDRWGASIQCIDRFLEEIPDSREGWFFKATLLLERNRFQEAERAFARYLEIEPADANAWCNRGVALQSIGLSDDALKSIKRCLEIDPNNEQGNNWLKIISGGDSDE